MSSLDSWRTLAAVIAASGHTLFVLFYLTSPWWKTFLGRALFLNALCPALLLNVAVASRMLDWSTEDETFVFCYFAVGFAIWMQLIAFVRVRLRHREQLTAGVPHE